MPRPPLALLVASAVQTLEGAFVVGLGALVGVSTLTGTPGDLGRALALAAFTLVGGVAMMAVAIGLLRRRRWSRAPAVVTQILAVLIGVQLAQSGQLAVAVPVAVAAVAALGSLFAPATSRELQRD